VLVDAPKLSRLGPSHLFKLTSIKVLRQNTVLQEKSKSFGLYHWLEIMQYEEIPSKRIVVRFGVAL